MYLRKLHITNFRCFKQYDIQFAPGVTVLFGKNGAGKTTLIHALHKALSFIMYSENIYETVKGKGKKKSQKKVADVKTITNNNPYLHPMGFSKDDFNNHEDKFIEVEAMADFATDLQNVEWKMSVLANNCKLRPSEFKSAFKDFYQWHLATGKMPLLAYISDSFPHREDNKKSQIVAKIRALRNFGYFDWDAEEGCTNEWIERLEDNLSQQVQLLAKGIVNNHLGVPVKAELQKEDEAEFEKYYKESKAIEDCFKTFTAALVFTDNHNIQVSSLALGKVNGNTGKLCIHTTDGREFPFRKLPAGYKRLFNIVLDLAYRSFILSDCTTTDISGVVIIDEIDLHLHPELEKVVLPQLRHTFPSLQFIVSTHSPLVLVGVDTTDKTNSILRMTSTDNSPEPVSDIYGLDYNSGLQDIMGVEASDAELDSLISSAIYLKENGAVEQYNNLYQLLLQKVHNNVQLLNNLIERTSNHSQP